MHYICNDIKILFNVYISHNISLYKHACYKL